MAFASARPLSDPRPMSDMNTTPLIDVLLVLLIMIILTIPPQTHKVAIGLPLAGPDKAIKVNDVRNIITVDKAGVIAWNGQAVDRARLRGLLIESKRLVLEPQLDLVPAADARYALVDSVIADIKRAQIRNLGLPGNEAYQVF
jgi:biopolymer transport protein ExbD